MVETSARVFISSVVDGFADFREAAAAGVHDAGMTPVLVNEQFPSLADSPRNACLDGVASCDVFLIVIGERGGWVAPSGKLVVEEELDEAVLVKLPVLVFLQDTPRDSQASTLATRVSDYTTGKLRKSFNTTEELRGAVGGALRGLAASMHLETTDLEKAFDGFDLTDRNSARDPIFQLKIVPTRVKELIEPGRFASQTFHDELILLLMQRGVAFFKISAVHTAELGREELLLAEGGDRQEGRRLALNENGHSLAEAPVVHERPAGQFDLSSSMVVDVADIEQIAASALRATGAIYDLLDPYHRHTEFAFNCGLWHLGFRTLARNPQPKSSHLMRMGEDKPLIAYSSPRKISRNDLSNPRDEVSRAVAKIDREASSG